MRRTRWRQCATRFTCCTAFLLSTSHVRLSRYVGAFLCPSDEVKQHVQAAVASAAEAVLDPACAGGLDRGHASEYRDLRHTEARARHSQFGDQPGSDDRPGELRPVLHRPKLRLRIRIIVGEVRS